MKPTCDVPRCRRETELSYIGRTLCAHHWGLLCDRERQLEALSTPVVADRLLSDILATASGGDRDTAGGIGDN